MKVRHFLIPILLVIFGHVKAQLNLPDMPGPPYPDKFGNNRWGVKYDPKIHGRGRGNSVYSSPSSSSGNWGGEAPQYSPGSRYREQRPQRSKWTSALKPLALVSRSRFSKNKSKRTRRPGGSISPAYNPTSDSAFQTPYSNKAVDSYVQSYLNTYNKVSQIPPGSNLDMVNGPIYARPTHVGRYRRKSFPRNGNRRSLTSDLGSLGNSGGNSGSLQDSYVKAAELIGDKAASRNVNPQDSFFGRKITKKKSDFAKTLSSLYNDYKPDGENADSGITDAVETSKSNPVSASATDNHDSTWFPDDDSFITRPLSAVRDRHRQYASGNPPLQERPTRCGDIPCPVGPPTYRRPRPSRPNYGDDDISFKGSHFDVDEPGSSVSLSGYMPGPPPPFLVDNGSSKPPSSSFISNTYTGSNPSQQVVTMQVNPGAQLASMQMTPVAQVASFPVAPISYISAAQFTHPSNDVLAKALSTLAKEEKDKERKNKPKKKRLQHTPVNVLRGLLGHDKRDRQRQRWRQLEREREEKRSIERERDTFKQAFAANIASFALPQTVAVAHQPVAGTRPPTATGAPPQYTHNPAVNSIYGVADYNRHFYSAGHPPPPPFADYPFPPPPPPMMSPPGGFSALSPLASGLSALRDTITGLRERPYRYPLYPPYPPPPRYRHPEKEVTSESKKEAVTAEASTSGPITQHLQDWPRIFTAMGTSVDAVAGGIHAVRKEITKMTGQTISKGILMGGSAVNEVSKGMAHVITKIATI